MKTRIDRASIVVDRDKHMEQWSQELEAYDTRSEQFLKLAELLNDEWDQDTSPGFIAAALQMSCSVFNIGHSDITKQLDYTPRISRIINGKDNVRWDGREPMRTALVSLIHEKAERTRASKIEFDIPESDAFEK